jgi:hypothetical protein
MAFEYEVFSQRDFEVHVLRRRRLGRKNLVSMRELWREIVDSSTLLVRPVPKIRGCFDVVYQISRTTSSSTEKSL